MNKKQAKRLLNVAKACRETKDKLDMEHYGHPCGTPACALGNYAARRDLQKSFYLSQLSPLDERPSVRLKDTRAVQFDGPEVKEHFGISDDEAWDLFGPEGLDFAKTGKKAARLIEKFVAEKTGL